MIRLLALVGLALLMTGCTRFGTNPAGGPFARKPKAKADPYPASPVATNSPLALPKTAPSDSRPAPRDGEAGVIPAGGIADGSAKPQILPRRRPDPLPGQIPSPFAAKDRTAPAPNHVAEVKKLVAAATEKWQKVDCYEATVTRRELAPNKKLSEDMVRYQFRKDPMAVSIKNLGESGKGREVIYFPSKHEDKIYSIIGKGDENILSKAGQKAPAVSPDFPMVKSRTRYSIREAGHGTPIARIGTWVAKIEAGKIPAENLTYLGEVNCKEYPYPLLGVELKFRPGDDPLLPTGGTRQWFFDTKPESPSYQFPVLIIATEANGKEVEYYLFEKMNFQVKFTDADFDPARLGKK